MAEPRIQAYTCWTPKPLSSPALVSLNWREYRKNCQKSTAANPILDNNNLVRESLFFFFSLPTQGVLWWQEDAYIFLQSPLPAHLSKLIPILLHFFFLILNFLQGNLVDLSQPMDSWQEAEGPEVRSAHILTYISSHQETTRRIARNVVCLITAQQANFEGTHPPETLREAVEASVHSMGLWLKQLGLGIDQVSITVETDTWLYLDYILKTGWILSRYKENYQGSQMSL